MLNKLKSYSSLFGPPKVDLREAQIKDCYGDEKYAQVPIHHIDPTDVTFEELDYYGRLVYAFMNFSDVVFYTYSVFVNFEKDYEFEHMDFLLYNYDRYTESLEQLPSKSFQILKDSCHYLFSLHGYHADWEGAKTFSKLMGIDISEKNINKWYENQNLTKRSTE